MHLFAAEQKYALQTTSAVSFDLLMNDVSLFDALQLQLL